MRHLLLPTKLQRGPPQHPPCRGRRVAQAPTTYVLAPECRGLGQGLLQKCHILTLPGKSCPKCPLGHHFKRQIAPGTFQRVVETFIYHQANGPPTHTPHAAGPGEALLNPSTATASHQQTQEQGGKGSSKMPAWGKTLLFGFPQLAEDGQCQAPSRACSRDASASLLSQNPMPWCLHRLPFTPSP